MQMSGRVEARECASAVRNPREAVCIASGSLSLSRCNSKRVEAVVRRCEVRRKPRAGQSKRICSLSVSSIARRTQYPTMALSISQKGKGRFRPEDSLDLDESSKFSSRSSSSSSASSSFSSSSGSESKSESEHSADDSEDEDEEEVTQEYLDSLLEKARASI